MFRNSKDGHWPVVSWR